MRKKLFLLDAYALIYRSFYAFIRNPRVNSKGFNTSAIFGFVNTLEEVLQKENPSHIAVAFDPPGLTFRHEEFEDYKAQREKTPEDIKLSVPIIKEIIEAYNIEVLQVDGYEADDVVGTIAKRANKDEFDVYMMTSDKDYAQLTEEHIYIYKPRLGKSDVEILNDKSVMKKYNLTHPTQMIDLLGLMGDASDNIPGCPNVGPKRAETLLNEFGSIENLLENTESLKGAVKKNVEENKEQIILSKYLATIKTDVPIDIEIDKFERKPINEDALRKIFEELEFRTLLNRILNIEPKKPKIQRNLQGNLFDTIETTESDDQNREQLPDGHTDIHSTPHTYTLVDTTEEIKKLTEKLSAQKAVAFDTETTGLDPLMSDIVGASFSYKEGEAFYVPLSPNKEEATQRLYLLKPFFENEKIEKIGQNIKYDILMVRNYGINVQGPLFDTMIAHYLLNPEIRHGMDFMADTYLKYKTVSIEEIIGPRGKKQGNMRDVDKNIVCNYACEDADITLRLKKILEKELRENQLDKLYYEMEGPLIYTLADMEWTGVRLDLNALQVLSKDLTEELIGLEKEIIGMAGMEYNVNSPKQTGEMLFDHLKIVEKAKKTKTGQYSTSEGELEKLRNKHPIIDKILEYRGLKKLLSTYIDAFPLLINPRSNKIHTSFNQTVAATGRLSSTNPNLQNIPIRDERGRAMRKVFIPDEGCTFLSADYSQIELRIMAHLSNDKRMTEAFNNDLDIHSATAAKIYKVPLEEATGDMREKAKTANFGIIYGISVFGLSERLAIPRDEAKDLIEGYFETYPDVKKYMDKSIEVAKEKGYVETLFGRKRFLPDINSRNGIVRGYAERNAINAPIQGSAADIIKVAMIRIFERFEEENLKSKMILQVHDELNFNVPLDELEKAKEIVIHEMENAYKLSVPLKTDCGWGKNWLEAH
ncbi:MAG: DNA polymerase I [Dysgonamonadaceae bacterium]|jgi:DNA polymerase-1|nr:DNA polymerase I [Dysgonamonadaceae bacterium]MDD4246775.1 DNA polymerase I [Dysgonamonadaceae bacterium]MDD4606444.1 DNA polymerase I [Dysgonamonadaceae bacterium]